MFKVLGHIQGIARAINRFRGHTPILYTPEAP